LKGSLVWTPVQSVVDALNDAFYEAFEFIPSTGEGYLFGLDISGSMFGGSVIGSPNLYPAEVSACMALAVAKRESNYFMFGFDNYPKPLKISPSMRLDGVLKAMRDLKWSAGGTNTALPMEYALQHRLAVDKMVVFTDNEVNQGKQHVSQALAKYRQGMNKPNTALIVCATSVTDFTVADPKDPRQMDIVGFDSAAPQLIQQF
jgi:60 kDa SS-A/Ro ribonucleoprotein